MFRSMCVLLNLSKSIFLVEARSQSFVGRFKRDVASYRIYRLLSDQKTENVEYTKKSKKRRNKWAGGKKLISQQQLKLGSNFLAATRPGFSEVCYNETSYYFENGLRKVYPYYYTFTAFARGRWVGKTIYNILVEEFRDLSPEEYEQSIHEGQLMVNYQKISKDYILKTNDFLVKVVHRHENPVLNEPVSIVHLDEETLVVNKPSSIPVHPCGRYRHNTVHFVLAKEHNLTNLFTVHRLDRLTSGLLLFGRTGKKAKQLIEQIRDRSVTKEYICRVEGEFPDKKIECNEPIRIINDKIGFSVIDPNGKECITCFKRLNFNGKTSVLLCTPRTGRMHQLRVHLQCLGFPIVNDPLYNHEVFGPQKGKGGDLGGKTHEQLLKDLIRIHIEKTWDANSSNKDNNEADTLQESKSTNSCSTTKTNMYPTKRRNSASQNASYLAFDPNKMIVDRNCHECRFPSEDPKPENLVMYLHAWKYEGPGWKYETELPEWARSDWVDT